METVKRITPPEWMNAPETKAVMQVIGGLESPPKSLFVGGCVRNVLAGREISDIDIATQLSPDEVMDRLKQAGIKAIPTGIDHGTVTAVKDGKSFEITTLRKDVETDGRHAVIAYTDHWEEDAQRRDFTMNALFAGMDGAVYDPVGRGLEDLEARQVIFIGDPAQRIAEDYLRILRFFRFHAQYGDGEPDQAGLKACREAADKIQTLSKERITQEFLKILAAHNPVPVLKIMFENNVMADFPDPDYQPQMLEKLARLQNKYPPHPNPLPGGEREGPVQREGEGVIEARLLVLSGGRIRLFEDDLRLSHHQKNSLIKIGTLVETFDGLNEKKLKKTIFYHGNELVFQAYLMSVASGKLSEEEKFVDLALHWQAPECPITGQTLLDEGYETGPELGRELEYRQEEWLDEVL